MITTITKKSYTNWMGGKKKANILRCVVIQMKIKINLKAPKWAREEKNDFHVCEIKVSSSFISGWFVEPRRLCACVYMKNMSRTLLLPLRSVYFFSLIHSEIFIHHSRFFSSFRLLTRSTSQITTLVYKFYKQTYTNMRVLLICVNF